MNNVFRLARQRLYSFRYIHLLAALLTALVALVFLLYQGHIDALTTGFRGRLIYPELPGAYLLEAQGNYPAPNTGRSGANLHLVLTEVTTAYGEKDLAAVFNSRLDSWPRPKKGEIWLPASLRDEVFQEQVGDDFLLTNFTESTWQQTSLRVAGYYHDGGYLNPLLVDATFIEDWFGPFQPIRTMIIYPEEAYTQLRRQATPGRGVTLTSLSGNIYGAGYLVSNMYQGGQAAILLGIVFLGIGIGTFALLVFLDSRGELAILKATGLKSGEARNLLLLEFSLSALLGTLLGLAALHALRGIVPLPVEVNRGLLWHGTLLVALAYGLALFAPARLASVATVNELLLKRPILLFSKSISALSGNRPALADLMGRGWSCLQLERDDSGFLGTVLPNQGDVVRQGELLAWQTTWFGMGEKRYEAPHDGIVRVIDAQRGVLALEKVPTLTNEKTV